MTKEKGKYPFALSDQITNPLHKTISKDHPNFDKFVFIIGYKILHIYIKLISHWICVPTFQVLLQPNGQKAMHDLSNIYKLKKTSGHKIN